jgi:hypothetical protein
MRRLSALAAILIAAQPMLAQNPDEQLFPDPIDVNVPDIRTDKAALYDYDIV